MNQRLYYLDNLKVCLTVLVILPTDMDSQNDFFQSNL